MKPITRFVSAAMAAFLVGACASAPEAPSQGKQFTEFYGDQRDVAYATEFPSASANEAIARGDQAYREGDSDLALYHYIRALNFDSENADTFYKIGFIHKGNGNQRLSALAFRVALRIEPEHTLASEQFGLILLERRDYENSKGLLSQAVAADPERWEAHNGLGVIADLDGNNGKAQENYLAAINVNPRSPMLLNNLGYSRYMSEDWGKAEELFRKALSYDEKYERAWMNLGLLYTRREKYSDAYNSFRRVLDEAEAINNMGYICLMEGHYDIAERLFQAAIEKSPSYFVAANENLKTVAELRD